MLTKTPASEREIIFMFCLQNEASVPTEEGRNTRRSAVNHELRELFMQNNLIRTNRGKATKCVVLPSYSACSAWTAAVELELIVLFAFPEPSLCTTCDNSVPTSRHRPEGQMFP